ncbi:hypothetical protein DSM112329_00106 [Paraconexibacter sp. AEG42_29]|uniref:Sugar O-methyltransferase n=1 Tax=Paraconexibacter sp. AEG42_29 TaxID=2997339 RepID=A0AAU7ANW5_9ACTN
MSRAPAIGSQHPLRRLVRRADDLAARTRAPGAQRRLERGAPHQRALWAERAAQAPAVLGRLTAAAGPPAGPWEGYATVIAALVAGGLPWDVLRRPVIQETMLVRGRRTLVGELDVLRAAHAPAALRRLLAEDPAGCPPPARDTPWTSPTAVHHLHHLTRFGRSTGADPFALDVVVEWGGGYGGLARLLRRRGGPPPTHVIVDLPAVLALQWVWLGTVLGPDAVVLLEPGATPTAGKVSLTVPAGAALPLAPDLIVSTWGLSETPADARPLVAQQLGGARHVLLAGQRPDALFPEADWPLDEAAGAGARREPVEVLAGSEYAFR